MNIGDRVKINNEYVDRDGMTGEIVEVKRVDEYTVYKVEFEDGVQRCYFSDDVEAVNE